jgi:hypothetical protein
VIPSFTFFSPSYRSGNMPFLRAQSRIAFIPGCVTMISRISSSISSSSWIAMRPE